MKQNDDLKGLEDGFAIVEDRVQALVEQNRALLARVAELERELARTGTEARELERLQGARLELRDRIEHILRALESVSGPAAPPGE
jgi:cell division septum initiation protein DivIVA